MDWLVVTEDYLKYLRKEEKRIPLSDYGEKKHKPFFGILFETEDFYYVTQISHAQKRHYKMKNGKDFKKIYSPKDNRLLAVVNLKDISQKSHQLQLMGSSQIISHYNNLQFQVIRKKDVI